jgi:hypothetical protein
VTFTNKVGTDANDFTNEEGTWHLGPDNKWYLAKEGWNGYKNEGKENGEWTLSWNAGSGVSGSTLFSLITNGVKLGDTTWY